MARYETIFLPYATGATSGASTAGSWINVEGLEDIVCQVTNRKGKGSAVATNASGIILVEGTFDDAHLDGSTVGFFRLGSNIVGSNSDHSLLALTNVGALASVGQTMGRFPYKWLRAKITTLEAGTPTVIVRGRRTAVNETSD